MPSLPADSLGQHFSEVKDPRNGHNIRHPLLNIITIAICGVIGGADSWVDIEMFGNAKRSWFETFLDLPHGIPSMTPLGGCFAMSTRRNSRPVSSSGRSASTSGPAAKYWRLTARRCAAPGIARWAKAPSRW